MKQNLDPLGYDNVNLLICMTLDVENLPSVAHRKKSPEISDMRATLEAQKKKD